METPAGIEVWDVNWPSVRIFASCCSLWRAVGGFPGGVSYLGLDYPGLDVVMRHLAPAGADAAALFLDLQVMEAAALAILNEARP